MVAGALMDLPRKGCEGGSFNPFIPVFFAASCSIGCSFGFCLYPSSLLPSSNFRIVFWIPGKYFLGGCPRCLTVNATVLNPFDFRV